MNSDEVLSEPQKTWPEAAALVLLVVTAITVIFFSTAKSMVDIWIRSETFAHGFLIIPIVLWLVWDKRAQLGQLTPTADYRVLMLFPVAGVAWLVAYLVDVQVIQQLAYVSLLILSVWTILGSAVARLLMFPLFFLYFSVPIGEGLIVPLMNFTADFTVGMVKLSGIPVYREGTFFSIPSGNWSVVEGCSGIRYLIASVTLGTLYAYLTYRKTYKRVLFVVASIVVPIIANGLRAYMIVMIGHLSDMKLALGVDHLIYGWVFFGIVIFIMFVIGSRWRDDHEDKAAVGRPDVDQRTPRKKGLVLAAVLSISLAVVWPLIGHGVTEESGQVDKVVVLAPAGVGGWQKTDESGWDWRPHIVGADGEIYQFYRKGDVMVGLYLGIYREQRQDAELVNSQNFMVVQKHPVWSNKWEKGHQAVMHGQPQRVIQSRLDSRDLGLTTWHWYRLSDQYSSNPYFTKLLEAVARLTGSRKDAAMLVLATPYRDEPDDANPALQDFIDNMLPGIEQSLEHAVGPNE